MTTYQTSTIQPANQLSASQPSPAPSFPTDLPVFVPLVLPELSSSKPSVTEPSVTESSRSSVTHEPRFNEPRFIAQRELRPVATTPIWGVEFARADMQQVVDRAQAIINAKECRYFVTANLNYLMLTDIEPRLARVNAEADLNIADGYPIVMRSRWTDRPLPCRVAGSDLIVELARLSATHGYRMFFLGAAPGVAAKAAARLQSMFPGLQVAGCYAPPFRTLDDHEHAEMLDMIRESQPDILLVAFGQPKGELWIHENYQQLGVPLSIQLGASFDFLAGTARRAPDFWQAIGCEWLYRSICEPKRLAPRYARNIAFLLSRLTIDARCAMKHTLQKISGSAPGVRPWRKSKSQPS